MGSRGEAKSVKRISSGKIRDIHRKAHVWTIKTRPGKHSKDTSIPLVIVLRDLLGVIRTFKEARTIVHQGQVKVDGVIRRDYRFSVGLFDVVDLENGKKRYRAVFDAKGRMQFRPLDPKEPLEKLVKIVAKRVRKGNNTLLQFNDGTLFRQPDGNFKVGDSLRISLPDNKIQEHFEQKNGNLVYLTGGTRIGTFARLKALTEGTIKKRKLVMLEQEKQDFQTVANNVFVVGTKNQPAINMGVEE